ncbi:MAG: protein-S-isoprenylcysteine O-methyltransferase Ste14 [Woeseiaceae bacterium]|jgi:protein-S-isoprenylcysteine O-methyltransferase Ste14
MSQSTTKPSQSKKNEFFDLKSALATSTLRGLGLAFVNMLLATLFILFAIANAKSFLVNPRLSVFLIVVTETIVAIFLVVRRDPDETHHSWQTWVTTTCGTLAPFLLRPVDATADVLLGNVFQISGFLLQIFALLALNRCIGLLPAYRGVKSSGLYGLVRHPLYMAYVITFMGYLLNNPSLGNLGIVVGGTGFLVMRIRYEELLLHKYADYVDYASKTRWHLMPGVW